MTRWYQSRWWYIERPFPWPLIAAFTVGGVLLSATGAFIAIEVIDGLEKFCQ